MLQNKTKINKEITKHIFKKLDLEKYIKTMNTSNNMPDNNMNRMFISYFRENLIAHLLNMKYVGDEKEWETDCVYPMNVENPKQFHIKYEIKIQKNMFLRNGNTNGIILKNGRGEGSKIKSLLKTILKNNFLLINSTYPYNIAYIEPTKFIFYFNGKKNAKTYPEIIDDESFLNSKCAELCAYAKKEDLFYVHEHDDPQEYKHGTNTNESFNPFKKIIDEYISNNL
uniref:Uncharacterized protein n=1 Tax=viral metagenome TaxID=1070528 RepID=A0A6C0LI00_9ZZZZ